MKRSGANEADSRDKRRIPVTGLIGIVRNDTNIALALCLLALTIRAVFVITHPAFDNLWSAGGMPYSDAIHWTDGALTLSQGYGFGALFRPLLSLLLALLYVWTGWSVEVGVWLNVIIAGITASFVYLASRVAFPREIALALALFFTVDPSQIVQMPQIMTESLGLFCSVVGIYLLRPGNNAVSAFWSGIFSGLSNLARPMTLFSAPFHVAFLLCRHGLRRPTVSKGLLAAGAFSAGIVLCISPWVVRQKLVYGIWSISSNTAQVFYGAVSSKYGHTWQPNIGLDATQAGVPADRGSRERYYMSRAIETIRTAPGDWVNLVANATWTYLNSFHGAARADRRLFTLDYWTKQVTAMKVFFWIASGMLALVAVGKGVTTEPATGIFFGISALVTLTLWQLTPVFGGVAILIVGVVAGFKWGSKQGVVLLAGSLVTNMFGSTIFNNPVLSRSVLITDWLFGVFYLAALYYAANILTVIFLRLARRPVYSLVDPSPSPEFGSTVLENNRLRRSLRIVGAAFGFFLLLSAARLIWVQFHPVVREQVPPQMDEKAKREALAQIRSHSKVAAAALPDANIAAIYSRQPKSATAPNRPLKEVYIESERLPHGLYWYPKNAGSDFGWRYATMPFARTVFSFSGGPAVASWSNEAIFEGVIPQEWRGRQVLLIGLISPPISTVVPRRVLHVIAIVPYGKNSGQLDYSQARFTQQLKPREIGILEGQRGISLAYTSPLRKSLPKRLRNLPVTTGGRWSVEFVNAKRSVPKVIKTEKGFLQLNGWAVVPTERYVAAEAVYLVLSDSSGKDHYVASQRVTRLDLSESFRRSTREKIGFQLKANLSAIHGTFRLQLLLLHQNMLYRCDLDQSLVAN